MSERDTIYVAVLDEGIDVWRPVDAEKLAPDRYLTLEQDHDPGIERWEFAPATVVRCRQEKRDGRSIRVAMEAACHTLVG
jgi:hypothetical protein